MLSKEEQAYLNETKQEGFEMQIITSLNFDFYFICPLFPLSRYLELLGYLDNQYLKTMSIDLYKCFLADWDSLDFKKSAIEASVVIIAINIYNR